jgi:hypothetical protein
MAGNTRLAKYSHLQLARLTATERQSADETLVIALNKLSVATRVQFWRCPRPTNCPHFTPCNRPEVYYRL